MRAALKKYRSALCLSLKTPDSPSDAKDQYAVSQTAAHALGPPSGSVLSWSNPIRKHDGSTIAQLTGT
jgi:hypothetical protein